MWISSRGPGSLLDAHAASTGTVGKPVLWFSCWLQLTLNPGKVFSFNFSLSPDPPVRYIQKKDGAKTFIKINSHQNPAGSWQTGQL